MATFVEFWSAEGREVIALRNDHLTVGRASTCDIANPSDKTLSGTHAVLERVGGLWCVRDLGSSNGTFVNGEGVSGARPLHHGDEIRMGGTRLVFRNAAQRRRTATEPVQPLPELEPREREILVALCAPKLAGSILTEPAATEEIAEALGLDPGEVESRLEALIERFGVEGEATRRVHRLANEAIQRGAVGPRDAPSTR